ncbi:unnamed protein product [Pipistrellus nathusii]|uniref:Uncharacterized protein n=1 Tax=Pipistrellus nathusii TaxID=59473 RepID=A0ABN9ZXN3_PIPNA
MAAGGDGVLHLVGPTRNRSVGLGDVSPADPAAARHSARDSLLPASAWGPRRPRPRSHPEGQDGGPGAPLEPGPLRVSGRRRRPPASPPSGGVGFNGSWPNTI